MQRVRNAAVASRQAIPLDGVLLTLPQADAVFGEAFRRLDQRGKLKRRLPRLESMHGNEQRDATCPLRRTFG